VHPDVLAHCPRAVEVIPVGKRGGCESTSQAAIARLMIEHARRGAIVGRVKGGDPCVFGRGGEEMVALAEAGIRVELVSGVTAGVGVPAALGIPLTHRDLAHGVTLVTGCTHDGGDEPDWRALARGRTTLVVYMGLKHVAHIAAALIAAGLAPDTPAAAIEQGTLPGQRQVVTRLGRLAAEVAACAMRSPALLVIGEVVRLAREGTGVLGRRRAA
jgi:uroporphyrin-III C-methyltransferase